MKTNPLTALLITFSCTVATAVSAQTVNVRKLAVFKETQDSVFKEQLPRVKTDKEGKITELYQHVFSPDYTPLFEEEYNTYKGRTYWYYTQYSKSTNPADSLFVRSLTGDEIFSRLPIDISIEYELSPKTGYPQKAYYKTLDEFHGLTTSTIKEIEYAYYPNGKIKYVLEKRWNSAFWNMVKQGNTPDPEDLADFMKPYNVLEYYTPEGKLFTQWGTLKDGAGTLIILNGKGTGHKKYY